MANDTTTTIKVQIKDGGRWSTLAKTDCATHAKYILQGLLEGRPGRIGRIVSVRTPATLPRN